jgi:hypothetical protein
MSRLGLKKMTRQQVIPRAAVKFLLTVLSGFSPKRRAQNRHWIEIKIKREKGFKAIRAAL